MRKPLRAAAACLLAAAAAVAAAVPATADSGDRSTIGGAELASHGVIVHSAAGVPPLPSGLNARSWLLADLDTGAVLAARDPHARRLPASTLKTLTAVSLIPRLDPSAMLMTRYPDVAVDGSKVGLVAGHRYQVDTLFQALMVVSGNDAAETLARGVGGDARAVALMNDEARYLNAADTTARTPSGLDAPGETSSAYDLALIGRAGLQMPAFRRYVTIKRSHVPAPGRKPFEIFTHNRLLINYPGAIGVKNGYTVKAQATFIGAATRGGHTLIVTLMHGDPLVWHQARALLDWGWRADGRVQPVGTLVPPGPLPESTPSLPAAKPASIHHGGVAISATADRLGHSGLAAPLLLGAMSALTVAVVAARWRGRRRRIRGLPRG